MLESYVSDVDRDPWGTSYRLVIWKHQTRQVSGAPTDVPTELKIVVVLFPKGAPRDSYPSDMALAVPLFEISELNPIPNKVLKATIREKP